MCVCVVHETQQVRFGSWDHETLEGSDAVRNELSVGTELPGGTTFLEFALPF